MSAALNPLQIWPREHIHPITNEPRYVQYKNGWDELITDGASSPQLVIKKLQGI